MIFPEVDLSGDEGSAGWHASGGEEFAASPDGTHYTWHRPPGLYHVLWDGIRQQWTETVREYEAGPSGFAASYYYLDGHPAFWEFFVYDDRHPVNHVMYLMHDARINEAVYLMVAKVRPDDERTDEDDSFNTKTVIWYEFGKTGLLPDGDHGNMRWHDWELDGGCATYEEVVTEIAAKVHEHYGNDRTIVDDPDWGRG